MQANARPRSVWLGEGKDENGGVLLPNLTQLDLGHISGMKGYLLLAAATSPGAPRPYSMEGDHQRVGNQRVHPLEKLLQPAT